MFQFIDSYKAIFICALVITSPVLSLLFMSDRINYHYVLVYIKRTRMLVGINGYGRDKELSHAQKRSTFCGNVFSRHWHTTARAKRRQYPL